MTDRAFLGEGWAFPVRVDGTGNIATVTLEEDVRQAVLIILRSDPGERVMRPDFGAGLRALTFEPINRTTATLAQHRIERALIEWEPRIDSVRVTVRSERAKGMLHIEVRYRIRSTNTFYNLVYPFYVQEGRA